MAEMGLGLMAAFPSKQSHCRCVCVCVYVCVCVCVCVCMCVNAHTHCVCVLSYIQRRSFFAELGKVGKSFKDPT